MSGSFEIPIQERDQVALQDAKMPTENNPVDLPVKEDLGAGLTSMANSMAAQQIKIERQQRIVAIHDVENKADALVDAANAKVVSAEGENAFVVADQAQKELKDKLGNMISNAPGIYRPDYINVANQRINRFDKVSQGHQYRQANLLADGIYKENASNLTDRMAMSPYGEPGEFDKNLEQLGIVTRQYVMHKLGGDVDGNPSPQVQRAIDVQVKAAQSTAVFKTIDALASTKDINNARAYAEKYADYLTTGDRIKVNGILDKGDKLDKVSKAMDAVEQVVQVSDDPMTQFHALEQMYKDKKIDGDTLQHAQNNLAQRTNFEKNQNELQSQRKLGEAYKEMAANGGTVTEDMYKNIDPKHWPLLNKYAVYTSEGKQVPLDSKFYAKKSDEIEHMSPEQARKEDPSGWDPLPPEYKKRLESKLHAQVNNTSSSRDVSDIAAKFIQSEITAKGGSKKQKEMLTSEFKTLSDDVYEQVKNSSDPKATKDEIRQSYQNLMAAKMASKDGHSWWDKTINGMQDHLSDLHHTEASTIFQSPEDQAIVNTVRQALKAQGKDTSDKNVFRYTRDIKNGIPTDIPVVGQSNMVNSPFIAPSKKVIPQQAPAPQMSGTRNPQSSGDPEIDRAFHFTTAEGKDDFKAFPYRVKYPDGTYGKETVGYGHEILPGEKFRYPVPESQAREIAYKDLKKAKTAVESKLKVPVTPEEKTVLTDLAFHLGPNHKSFLNTINLYNSNQREKAIDNISKIDSSSHGDMGGLSNRANDRVNHILKGMKLQKSADDVKHESL